MHDEIQLRDREDALRAAAADTRTGIPDSHTHAADSRTRTPDSPNATAARPCGDTTRWRRARPSARRRMLWSVSSALAATVAVALTARWIAQLPGAPIADDQPAIAFALKPTRSIEIRLSYPCAASHRPYDAMLGSPVRAESISPAVIAQLDAAHDCRGVATAYLLAGAWELADQRFRDCPASLDLDADRAGFAVLRGQLEDALALTERVLAAAPDHRVALWNRALALRQLGLGLAAGAAFDRVAALDQARDPGWAHEAAARAAEDRTSLDRMRSDYVDVERLGADMARGGAVLDLALARRVPGRARIWLHNALRTATTAARVDQIAELARVLDGIQGDGLARYAAQARGELSAARAAASPTYLRMVEAASSIDDPTWAVWLTAASRAGLRDVVLGGRLLTRRLDGAPSADELAAATGDPWFVQAVALARAQAALDAGHLDDAAARLATVHRGCAAGATSFRCLQLAIALARLGFDRDQPAEAMRHVRTALGLSRQLGEWPQRAQALTLAGDVERLGGDLALARGYFEEAVLARMAYGQPCDARAITFTMAEMLYQHHRPAAALVLATHAPACSRPPSTVEVVTLTRLVRSGYPVLDRASVRAAIAQARDAPGRAGERLLFDFLVEWPALDDRPDARDRIAAMADPARRLEEGGLRAKLAVYIDGALFADAARRRAWSDALAIVARARGVAPPARCALAFGADDFRFAVIAIGPDGGATGRYEPDTARGASWLAPEAMRRALAGCDEVAVLALPPWLGIGPVLDPATAWHYVMAAPLAAPTGPRRHVAISDPVPPPDAELAPLVPRSWSSPPQGPDEVIRGAAATPEAALAAIADATLVEIQSHAILTDPLDPPALALSPGARGWTLDARRIAASTLSQAPVVVLADCSGGVAARLEDRTWGLPQAFRTAGARAVIASLSAIPSREAAAFFDTVVAALVRGVRPASAVARARAEKLRIDPTSWVRDVVVFE
jgi:tetratricopeptide (TPR) repeat protein